MMGRFPRLTPVRLGLQVPDLTTVSLALCTTFGHLRVNIEYLKLEIVLIDWGALGSMDAGDKGGGRGSGASA